MSLTIFVLICLFSLARIDGMYKLLPNDLKLEILKSVNPNDLVDLYIDQVNCLTETALSIENRSEITRAAHSIGVEIARQSSRLSSESLAKLSQLFFDNSEKKKDIHSESFQKAVMEKVVMEKSFGKAIAGRYALLLELLASYPTKARQIYKDMFDVWILRNLRSGSLRQDELCGIVQTVLTSDRRLHNGQLLMVVSSRLNHVGYRKLCDLYYLLFTSKRFGEYQEFLKKVSGYLKRISGHLDANSCMKLNQVFSDYRGEHDEGFVALVAKRTRTAIEDDVKRSVFQLNSNENGMNLDSKTYLLHKNVLDDLGIGYVITVPTSVVHLSVSHVRFNEDKLKLFRFQGIEDGAPIPSKLATIDMDGHQFQSLAWNNFGKYFGTAALCDEFRVNAHNGQVLTNTSAMDTGIPRLFLAMDT